MPAALSIPMNTKRFNWGMKTDPEPGLDGREVNLPRGKGLGGASSINGMCWVRGNPMDYELWEALGADGWRWSNVLPYFQRLENVEGGGPLRGTVRQVEHLGHEVLLFAETEAKGRLVEKHHRRPVDQGTGEIDALPLSGAERTAALLQKLGQPE